jgi:hypothetical protein
MVPFPPLGAFYYTCPEDSSAMAVFFCWEVCIMQKPKLVGYGVDTLIQNMRYTDEQYQSVKQELAEVIAQELEDLQRGARKNEMAMISPWSFLGVLIFVEPHGAGKQWRWLLTLRGWHKWYYYNAVIHVKAALEVDLVVVQGEIGVQSFVLSTKK